MRKLLPFFALLALTAYAADTYTTRAGIVKPEEGSLDWGPKIRAAYDVIDSSFAILAGTNNFSSTQTFSGPINATTVNVSSLTVSTVTFSSVTIQAGTPSFSGGLKLRSNGCTGCLGQAVDIYESAIGGARLRLGVQTLFSSLSSIGSSTTLYIGVSTDTLSYFQVVIDSYVVTISSLSVTGPLGLTSLTAANIRALTPRTVGQEFYCADCATVTKCTSTGTVAGAWSLVTNRTSTCQ